MKIFKQLPKLLFVNFFFLIAPAGLFFNGTVPGYIASSNKKPGDTTALHHAKLNNTIVAPADVAPCPLTAGISGENCVGSILKATSNLQPQTIKWQKDGVVVETQTASPYLSPVIVAGGHGNGNRANQLHNPDRIWVDEAGNIYIPEITNNRVQKWAPGAIEGITVAGGHGAGSAANQLYRPSSVYVDPQGNIYITDQHNNRIQKWAPGATSGVTFAKDLNDPTSIALDKEGNVYVSEQFSFDIKMFKPGQNEGIIVAGGNGYGSAANQLAGPSGIFFDDNDGYLYIVDTGNNRIQKWKPGEARGVTVAGNKSGNSGSNSKSLRDPLGVCVDSFGNIFITDHTNGRVQEWAAGATYGTTIAKSLVGSGIMYDVYNNLYVVDYERGIVYKFINPIKGTYTALTPGKYNAVITTKDGCTVTTNIIDIVADATPGVTISANKTILCDRFATLFTATPVNGGSAARYQWKINGVNTGGNVTSATFSNTGLKPGDVVSCVLTSSISCNGHETAISNSITLEAPTQVCSVTIASSTANICKGTSLKFRATPVNAGLNPGYQWTVNNSSKGTGSTFTTSTLNDGDQVACVITSDAIICQVNDIANSNSITVNVNPVLTPAITISSNGSVFIKNAAATFTATATNAGNTVQYQWQVNGIAVGANSYSFTSSSLNNDDVVNCIITSNAPCVTSKQAISNSIKVKIIVVITPPNTFTPNSDGFNDTWVLEGITAYPKCEVSVFTRYGQQIFHSIGYGEPWNGSYKGAAISSGTYYYVIRLNDTGNNETLSGHVTILR